MFSGVGLEVVSEELLSCSFAFVVPGLRIV